MPKRFFVSIAAVIIFSHTAYCQNIESPVRTLTIKDSINTAIRNNRSSS